MLYKFWDFADLFLVSSFQASKCICVSKRGVGIKMTGKKRNKRKKFVPLHVSSFILPRRRWNAIKLDGIFITHCGILIGIPSHSSIFPLLLRPYRISPSSTKISCNSFGNTAWNESESHSVLIARIAYI